ncbi:MAG: hypothetical protein NDF57_05210 [archaeon GBS-70-058]|nr:hypothetical protein [Candidatus Culexarchaeum nevadense]
MALADKMKRKYRTNVMDKGDVWLEEIKRVPVNPMELAAAQNEVRIAKLKEIEALWPEIMRRIPKDVWLRGAEGAGRDNYNTSVRAKTFKYEGFADKFGPVLEEAKKKAAAMPGKTLSERLKRVEEVVKMLIEKKGKWRVS